MDFQEVFSFRLGF